MTSAFMVCLPVARVALNASSYITVGMALERHERARKPNLLRPRILGPISLPKVDQEAVRRKGTGQQFVDGLFDLDDRRHSLDTRD